MRVVVTGAAGFIGSHVVTALLEAGHEAIALVRAAEAEAMETSAAEVVTGELRDQASLRAAFAWAGAVVHCAALVDPYANPWDARAVNWIGAFNVAHAASDSRVPHLIHMSSIAVWHRSRLHGTLTEDDLVHITEPPVFDTYSPNKAAAERTLTDFGRAGRLQVTIFRPGAVYGPGDHFSGPLAAAIKARRFAVISPRSNRFPLVHVDDVASAVVAAIERPPATVRDFNLAGPELATVTQFVDALAAARRAPGNVPTIPYAMAHRAAWVFETLWNIHKEEGPPPFNRFLVELLGRDVVFDTSRVERELSWVPRVSLADGLARTSLWLEQNSATSARSIMPV